MKRTTLIAANSVSAEGHGKVADRRENAGVVGIETEAMAFPAASASHTSQIVPGVALVIRATTSKVACGAGSIAAVAPGRMPRSIGIVVSVRMPVRASGSTSQFWVI
ncbi:MAG TPA: hypothetical protein VGB83_09010, partial [Actinomycetota bacterium]